MYSNTCTSNILTHAHCRLLETNVEGLRVDVVDRRCRVSEREVDELTKQVKSITKTVRQLEGTYM